MSEFVTNIKCAHCGNKEFLILEALLQCTGCKKYRYNPEAIKDTPKSKSDQDV